MHISYNEFHITKKIRDLCKFDEGLFASSGNVIFGNMKNVRLFAVKYNQLFTKPEDDNKKVSAGQLNAMGLLDEIFHHVSFLYRKNMQPDILLQMLAELDKSLTKEKTDELLLEFMKEFPPTEVYQGNCTAEEYLARSAIEPDTGLERTNREQTLEELILLHLANENPAFKPFNLLFDDSKLAENSNYAKSWAVIQAIAKENPNFGPFNHDLITMLREPVLFSPESLRGQLEYIQKYWDSFMEGWISLILKGLDTISEEEKAAWAPLGGGGPGDGPDMQPYSYENLMNEYERFSADSEWMPKVILMAKTVLVWLDQLTKQYGYPITRLDQIPDAELDKLRDEGFTGLWLIGLWERSKASRRIKQLCGNPEAAASAYSLFDYEIAENIGGWSALENLRTRLWQRGIRLASDMVPNHTGMDGDWVVNRPDLFVQRRDNPFPQYTYTGENLSQDSRVSIYLEDHYYSKDDCSVVFKRVDNQTGDTRYIYHGNDGTGLPWNDTAQIDFLNPEAREAVMQQILHVAQNFPIIRFDAAMVLAKKSIRRLWYPEPGHGGDIATRSETGLSTQQFNDAIPNEFWREVVDRVAAECPDTLLLAEAFWMMEGYFVRTLGMHRVYNSAFMNMLKKEENQKYRDTVKNTINFDPQILKRYVNFMNNPDEETAIAQFGDGDKYFGVCTLMITMPGLPMFGHGQIEGFTEKYGMEYTKAYKDEKPSDYLVHRHWQEIFPLMKKRYLFANVENFLFYDLWENGHVNENVFAYSNGCGDERAIVFYNNKYDSAAGWIKLSDPYAVKTGDNGEITLKTRTLSEGLGLSSDDDKYLIFRENRSNLWFIRKCSEICEKGMYVMLNGFEYQVYLDVQQVTDAADHRYKVLCEFLNGRGCENIEIAWQELIYADLYKAYDDFAEDFIGGIASAIKKSTIDTTTVAATVSVSAKEASVSSDSSEPEKTETVKKSKSAITEKAKEPEKLTSYNLDEKTVSKILENCKESAINFYTVADKFHQEKLKSENVVEIPAKAKKSVSEKALTEKEIAKETEQRIASLYKNFTSKTKLLFKIFNMEKSKKPADLLKALAKATDVQKFAALMLPENEKLTISLIGWAMASTYAENGMALQWNLSRKFAIAAKQNKLSDSVDRTFSSKLYLLDSCADKSKLLAKPTCTTECKKFVEFLCGSQYRGMLSGANNFDNIWWFNKELIEESINQFILLKLFDSTEKQTADIIKLYKTINEAKLKAAYKCELFVKAFTVEKKSAKTKTVKTKKTSADAKKTSSKTDRKTESAKTKKVKKD